MKKITLFLVIAGLPLLVTSLKAQTKVIYTLAGNGWSGFLGDGGPANNAELSYPQAQVVDASGNVYIADAQNNRIRKVDASGTITTIGGNGTGGFSGDGGPATAAELHFPNGIAIDGAGNLYIADDANNRIREINTSGIISTVAGNGSKGYGGDGGPATAAKLNAPQAVAVDPLGNFYIGDYYNQRVRKVNLAGTISTYAGTGSAGFGGDGGPATAAKINGPVALYIDASGNVYLADYFNNRIREINSSGIINTIAGNGTGGFSGDGTPATAAELNAPAGVAIDASGNIYISDQSNQRIRMINSGGTISTFAGNGSFGYSGDGGAATDAELFDPCGLAVDGAGVVYIADQQNDAIRDVQTVMGVNNITLDGASVNMYPNPASSKVYLSFTQAKNLNASIEVIDMQGKQLIKDTAIINSGKVVPVDISGLANGVYFVKITADSQTKVLKFVKQ